MRDVVRVETGERASNDSVDRLGFLAEVGATGVVGGV